MESINQFRQYVERINFGLPNAIIVRDGIDSYIESIEDEHARLMRQAIEKAHADGERSAMKQIRSSSVDYQKGYEAAKEECSDMRDFCERLEDAAKNREDVTLFDVDYVALPVGEDGVAIMPGDIIDGYDCTAEVACLILARDSTSQGWFIFMDNGCMWEDSHAFTHHKKPDITSILRDFTFACEYAKKFQGKGE